jgi:hypothetical protein
MTLHRHHFSTRPVSLVLIAALAGFALWSFRPWSAGLPGGSGTSDAAAAPALHLDGQAQATVQDGIVRHLVVPVTLSGGEHLSLDGAILHAETSMSPTAAAAVPASYSVQFLDGNGDTTIDSGEHAQLIVDLPDNTTVYPQNPLDLVFRLPDATTVGIADVLR